MLFFVLVGHALSVWASRISFISLMRIVHNIREFPCDVGKFRNYLENLIFIALQKTSLKWI